MPALEVNDDVIVDVINTDQSTSGHMVIPIHSSDDSKC